VHSGKVILPIDDNQLCLQCHRADIYDTYNHTFHKKTGEPGKPLLLEGGRTTVAVGEGAKCVSCHMPGRYYMGVDYRRDHSIRIPRPDLSMRYGTPNACTMCHTDKSDRWAENSICEWYGTSRRHHYGEVLAKGRSSDPAALDSLILMTQDILFPVVVRATAITLLQNYPRQKSFDAITKAFSDPESLIREAAVRSLPSLEAQAFRKALQPMLFDPVKAVRMQAAFRLSAFPRRQIEAKYQKAYNKALKEYREAMLYMGDFAGSRHNLGILYANQGQVDNAIASYEEAIRIDNLFFPARINLALLYNQKGENDKAEEMLKITLEAEPDFAEGYYYLGLLKAEKKEYAEALKYLEEAARRMPEYTRINYNISLLYQQLYNPARAERYLLKCLDADPQNYDYLYAAATLYLKQGEREKAARYALLLKKYYPGNPAGENILNAINQ
jgi:tetratricopeptide (TPR) repeat protein